MVKEYKVNVDTIIQKTFMKSASIKAPLDMAVRKLKDESYRVISLKEIASIILNVGKESDVYAQPSITKECILNIPKKGYFLSKVPMIVRNAKEAEECNLQDKEFYLTDEQVDEMMNNAVEIDKTEFPASEFENEKVTSFVFERKAKDYGLFLKAAGIKKMSLDIINKFTEKPYARSVIFRISVIGDYLLDGKIGVRGVQYLGGYPRYFESFTPKQIGRALSSIDMPGIEDKLISELRILKEKAKQKK